MSCKAPGWSQNESDIELTHSSSSTLKDSPIQEGASSELDYEEAYEQLERMKQRVLQMKSMVLRTLPTKSAKGAVPTTDRAESDSDRFKEVQLETSWAFQQIDAVKSRLKETSEELSTLGARIHRSECCTNKLAKELEAVPKWMDEQRQHSGVCLERYYELDTTCCNYLDYSNHMRPIKINLRRQLSVRIPLKCYKLDYKGMTDRLGHTRKLMHQTRETLTAYLEGLEETLASTKPPPELPSLLELAEQLLPNQRYDSLRHSIEDVKPHSERLVWYAALPKIFRKPLITVQSLKVVKADNAHKVNKVDKMDKEDNAEKADKADKMDKDGIADKQ